MLKFGKPNFSRRWELAGELQPEPADRSPKRPQTSDWPNSRKPLPTIIALGSARIYFELEVTW